MEDIVEADPRKEEEITYKRKKKTGRRGISDDLPRVDELFDLSEKEKIGMKYIGEEISEKLEITPMKIFVRRIIRKKYVKEGDLKSEFKIAPLPSQILPKTMASSSLLSHIIISKYCDALPLYRQVSILKRASGELTRQTMARWLIQVSEKLIPLYNLLQEKLLDSNYLQMDETTVQVLKEDGKRATSKSYMWVRLRPGDCPIILYDYDPTRRGSVPLELLLGFKGYLQCDGYDGYSPACNKYGLKRVGCWDHARRKFFDAFKSSNGKGVGKKGLDYIKKIYKVEKEIRSLESGDKKRIRKEKSLPILKEFKFWIDEIRSKIIPNSLGGKAINYAFNEWAYLEKYLEDGNINISNAWIENAIHPFTLGRKNWLFSASVDGAKASAMFYSLIETAKRNEIEPFDYFNKMLDKIPDAQELEDFERLLPLKNQFLIK